MKRNKQINLRSFICLAYTTYISLWWKWYGKKSSKFFSFYSLIVSRLGIIASSALATREQGSLHHITHKRPTLNHWMSEYLVRSSSERGHRERCCRLLLWRKKGELHTSLPQDPGAGHVRTSRKSPSWNYAVINEYVVVLCVERNLMSPALIVCQLMTS